MKAQTVQALKVQHNAPRPVTDSVIVEEPLQICINGRSFSITMRTPGADRYLVKGLLFSEGIVRPEGLGAEIATEPCQGFTRVDVRVPSMYLCERLLEKRSLLANASCGICGKQEVDDIAMTGERLTVTDPLDASLVRQMSRTMRAHQRCFDATGGCHAAGAFGKDGSLIALFEDVGRHNAVDKVVGYLIERHRPGDASVLCVSGRVSYEIVAKAFAARIPFLCAVSAPSSMSIEMAERFGMTLFAFCRDDRFTIYANPQQVWIGEPQHV